MGVRAKEVQSAGPSGLTVISSTLNPAVRSPLNAIDPAWKYPEIYMLPIERSVGRLDGRVEVGT
jgi:hypothetical protein